MGSKIREIVSLGSATGEEALALVKDVIDFDSFAIQVVYEAGSNTSNTGNCSLMCSLDYDRESGVGNWTTVADSTQALDVENGGVHVWNVSDFVAPFIRVDVDDVVANAEVIFVGKVHRAK